MAKTFWSRFAVATTLLALVAGCGTTASPGGSPSASPSASASSTATPTPTPTPLASVAVYFLRNGKIATVHRLVARGDSVGALGALLSGPSAAEQAMGMTSGVPAGTALLYVSWDGPAAMVNLSHQFASGSSQVEARLAQVVFTVTQFAPISQVQFEIEGKPITSLGEFALNEPVGRSAYEALSPAILVESPAVGDAVSSPITVRGTANTYEAVFQLQVVDSNNVVVTSQTVHASSGTGTRGTFSAELVPPSSLQGSATVRAFEYSAKDGSAINQVDIPIFLKP